MLNHSFARLGIGLPLAALVVLALFGFMRSMIEQTFSLPAPDPQRVLERIVFSHPESEDPRVKSRQPEKLELADQPPPPPKASATPGDVDLPAIAVGHVPENFPVARVLPVQPDTVLFNERSVTPVSPPVASYPSDLATRGVEGRCDVRFDVDPRGRPFNVSATCSHPGFRREAERAVARVNFVPELHNGQPVSRRNVVFPIEFRLDE
ncbi:energy transducer TonB [Henriciella aquimarina]|uniref:energy transducer TonB n=1 Tax=Henriciella aquimarina TaxID=545261 RepID=UPI000A050907|nr:energy transducer TonB [Henriciella aquimarina]